MEHSVFGTVIEGEYPDDVTGAVVRAMAEILRDETPTYGELADRLDTAPSRSAATAIGTRCR